MRTLLVICLGVLILWPSATVTVKASESFVLAERFGEPINRYFFAFSTSAGGYLIRDDGVGEFTTPARLRRHLKLRVGAKERIHQIYFLEHQGDLFLLYEGHNESRQWVYLTRIEPQKRKVKWTTALESTGGAAPLIEGEFVVIGDVSIRKSNGAKISL